MSRGLLGFGVQLKGVSDWDWFTSPSHECNPPPPLEKQCKVTKTTVAHHSGTLQMKTITKWTLLQLPKHNGHQPLAPSFL